MGAKLDLHLDKRWYLFTHEILMDIDCVPGNIIVSYFPDLMFKNKGPSLAIWFKSWLPLSALTPWALVFSSVTWG